MLILCRKVNESIYIGDDIIISVREIRGNQARIGVKAPSKTEVYREEVYRRIQREKIYKDIKNV